MSMPCWGKHWLQKPRRGCCRGQHHHHHNPSLHDDDYHQKPNLHDHPHRHHPRLHHHQLHHQVCARVQGHTALGDLLNALRREGGRDHCKIWKIKKKIAGTNGYENVIYLKHVLKRWYGGVHRAADPHGCAHSQDQAQVLWSLRGRKEHAYWKPQGGALYPTFKEKVMTNISTTRWVISQACSGGAANEATATLVLKSKVGLASKTCFQTNPTKAHFLTCLCCTEPPLSTPVPPVIFCLTHCLTHAYLCSGCRGGGGGRGRAGTDPKNWGGEEKECCWEEGCGKGEQGKEGVGWWREGSGSKRFVALAHQTAKQSAGGCYRRWVPPHLSCNFLVSGLKQCDRYGGCEGNFLEGLSFPESICRCLSKSTGAPFSQHLLFGSDNFL